MKSTPVQLIRRRHHDPHDCPHMRHAVRQLIRDLHGRDAKPPGEGWLFIVDELDCPRCGTSLVRVGVPRFEATRVHICETCQCAFAGIIAQEEGL